MNDNKSQYRKSNKDIIVFHNKNEIPYISIPHLHSRYEIYYNIRGARGFMLNGNFYKCKEHEIIVIPKVQIHKVIVDKNAEYERCIININEYIIELLEIMCDSNDIFSWIKGKNDNIPNIITLSNEQHNEYIGLINDYNESEKKGDRLEIFGKFIKIMLFLKNRFESFEPMEYMQENELSYPDKVFKIVEESFKTVSVSDIAENIFINEDYANRTFKEETGLTIKKYLTLRKIAEAKKHLFSGKSVKEACVLSGFRDYSNFIRTFKKYEGYAPGKLNELTRPI